MTLIGTTVGRIRIVGSLGKGGMGEVYLGYDETLQRKVALKAIRGDKRLDAEAKARFLREARILSQLDHPGICRIHEFIEGEDSDFLVLELIAGRSLRAALAGDLDPARKLVIAEWVAEALVAAHAKGVVHRDLKPENVMLTNDGEVKVLDFGLAHTVDEELAARLALAKHGDAGSADAGSAGVSPAHAGSAGVSPAPEPSQPSEPHPLDTLPPGTEPELARTVPGTPPGPGGDGTFVATRHGMVMGTVAYMSPEQAQGERATAAGDMYSFGLLMQELFTGRLPYEKGLSLPEMLLKAAHGDTLPVTGIDPDLAELIQRLKSLAPEARPTAVETAARLKWIRGKPRRRLRRLAAVAVAAALVLGGLKYTFDLRREQQLAIEARREAEEVSSFLLSLFEVSDPQRARGDTITARELLDEGARKIAGELAGQPLAQSRMMRTMGGVYRQLGLYHRARPLLEEALAIQRRILGAEHLETARAIDQLANLYHDQGDYARAEPLFVAALEIREQSLGPRHPHVAASVNNLAFHYRARGDGARAEPLFQRALEIQQAAHGPEHPDVAKSLNNLGDLYRLRGEPERAEPYLRRAIEVQEKLLGADHPSLAMSLNNLAMIYHQQGDTARAEPLYERTLAISETVLGPDHPNVATSLNNLAELYRAAGDYSRAEPLFLRALAIQERALGAAHPGVAVTLGNLADLYGARGQPAEAEPRYLRALAIQEAAHDPAIAVTLADLADLYVRQGRYGEARTLYERARAGAEKALAERPDSRADRGRLAAVLVGEGKLHAAEGEADRAADEWTHAADLLEPLMAGSGAAGFVHTRALALLYLGRLDEARPLVERLAAGGWRHPELVRLAREHGLMEPTARTPPARP